ncbi:SHOCT-like domain-containing protein [Clostridium thermarum]|uniref:SHOCT-like domain-containing protein n=1 Tax=Clostridium thermarum TaxID=1716543 RepID=UPI0013D21113|nr:hypothetical protein [Clostridium thermarum]
MNEEILRILKMVEEGKIDSQKGAQLIEALKVSKKESETQVQVVTDSKENVRNKDLMLKIKVKDEDGNKVNVNLPVKFVSGIISATGRLPVNLQGVEGVDINGLTNALNEAINSGMVGKIVDIESEDGDVVEITIE